MLDQLLIYKVKKNVVVVGGGFAGINLAKELDPGLFEVLLIDKINYHQFQPLLYQVATAQIEPSSVSFPIRYVFRNNKHIRIRLANAEAVDAPNKKLETSIGDIEYDYLILALGGKTNFFGNNELAQNAISLKSTSDALKIRNHILQVFEKIVNQQNNDVEALCNIVIVGGGPTGVELSGAFAEIKKYILPKDFHRIDFSKLKIILIEGSDHTLGSMSKKSQEDSQRYLEKMGVEIRTNTIVKSYDGEVLTTQSGETIKTKTVIWSAGIMANGIKGIPTECIGRGGRIKVNRINQLTDHPNIFVVGDMAMMETPKYPNGHPQLANVAIQQANNLAKNLRRIEQQKPTTEYEYRDLGTMATIGRNRSVVDIKSLHIKGFFAWVIWMFLHLMLILSVRNKLIIFINWAWAYISKNTALRLILEDKED
ncbi:MAG: NAD(P)/FAD-dependent oxidoreductase [Bacteroidetes bacterium]|nr:NAD(P)/FAD-dependent oxidoreductase [Bacteroidota bacterium]